MTNTIHRCRLTSWISRYTSDSTGLILAYTGAPSKQKETRRTLKMALTSLLFAALVFDLACGDNANSNNNQNKNETFTFSVLYRFTGTPDGAFPVAGVVIDSAGNLYGTTASGGLTGGRCSTTGCGTVFKLDASGNETILYRFTGLEDGGFPQADLVRDAVGNLYGTAAGGGSLGMGNGNGVVFKLDVAGTETVLHTFNGMNGTNPLSGLVRDAQGNLYGTTLGGGGSGSGVVFKLDSTGNEILRYDFAGLPDASGPWGNLVRDSDGNIFGTTIGGGTADGGAVFKLNASGNESVLYSFQGGPTDGHMPQTGLVLDMGNLYGTTIGDGAADAGVVFKVDANGKELVLHNFGGPPDGAVPEAGLVRDAAGSFFGTTGQGGTSDSGSVFKLDSTGKETVIYSFTGGTDGAGPQATLIMDSAGNLYGTTQGGGTSGNGVVFKLTRNP